MRIMTIALLLALMSSDAMAQNNWKLKRDEDGIKIYTTDLPNSDFKSIKVSCTVTATQSQLIAFLLDIDKQPEWVYNTRSSKLVKKIKDNELVFYSIVDVPWPCANRDYIAHFIINQVSPSFITIDSRAEPALLPDVPGMVRVQSSVSHWEITTLNSNLLNIVYTVQFDPGGSMPAWLTNLFVTKGPFHSFQHLRAGVGKPQYQNAHVDFIK